MGAGRATECDLEVKTARDKVLFGGQLELEKFGAVGVGESRILKFEGVLLRAQSDGEKF